MSRRKPPRRIAVDRHSDNDKRRLRDPPPDLGFRRSLTARARFEGSGKHKLEPRAFGLNPASSGEDYVLRWPCWFLAQRHGAAAAVASAGNFGRFDRAQ